MSSTEQHIFYVCGSQVRDHNLKEMGGVKPVTTLQRWETSPDIRSARFLYKPDPGNLFPPAQ
jgi:hypothetical protein